MASAPKKNESPQFTNRLTDETSPYLLQHAQNPVDWYPWGPEALEKAQEEDKPILLSIGYSACHWCHVMERESFENEATAELMNDHFINVKVDREERPDLDSLYMTATQALNQGHGGWPMTVFLAPDQRPFLAGTYFPPEPRYGMPSFPQLLEKVTAWWNNDRDKLMDQAGIITEHLQQAMRPGPSHDISESELKLALKQYLARFDTDHGGFGPAPKFPPSMGLELLLRIHHKDNNAQALQMVERTLKGMARGGMYDHLAGGFCRYSTDERWLVPHFEKMLYDNALLVPVYLSAYQVTGKEFYKQVATETLDYILKEMTSPEGGFYSATDADSEGVEGKFFVWTPDQIKEVLGEEAGRNFCTYFDITAQGNWEGKSIPNTPLTLEEVAQTLKLEPAKLQASLVRSRRKLYEARLERIPPSLDDKVLTAWNGLIISALARGYRTLHDPRYLEAADSAARFIKTKMVDIEGCLLRVYRQGQAKQPAFLEDHAYLARGLIDLFEAGGEMAWLQWARELAGTILEDYLDQDSGAFHATSTQAEQLIHRHLEGTDGAIPAANSLAAETLARLSFHLDLPEHRKAAQKALMAHGDQLSQAPSAFASALNVVDLLLTKPLEIALVGKPGKEDFEALRREMGSHHLPNMVLAQGLSETDSASEEHPLLKDKTLVDGKAALYICENFTCQEPITDLGLIEAKLSQTASS